MRHRAGRGDAEVAVGDGARRCGTAADVRGACAEVSAVRALRAAAAEFGDGAALGGADNAVCLGGDQRLVVDGQQEIGLDKLCLGCGGAHRDDRLTGEDRRALGDGVDVAGEAEGLQLFEKGLVEYIFAAEIGNILLREVNVFNVFDELLKPCGNGKAAAVRDVAEEHVEVGDAVRHAGAVVAVCHRQLVVVAEHRKILSFSGLHRCYCPFFLTWMMRKPQGSSTAVPLPSSPVKRSVQRSPKSKWMGKEARFSAMWMISFSSSRV